MANKHVVRGEIILDNNKYCYEAGEEVSGVFKISTKGDLSLADISIGLVCLAEVKWMESYNDVVAFKEVVYLPNKDFKDSKQYLDLKYEVFKNKKNSDRHLIDGNHVIGFKFQLPEGGIPSSFDGDLGYIKYYVEAVVKEEYNIHSKIIVSSPIRDRLKTSVGGSTEKELGILNLASGKVRFHATVDRKGFAAGEFSDLHCYVWNESTVDVTPRATLYKQEIYMCDERHKAVKYAITEPIVGPLMKKSTNYTESLIIPIPQDVTLSIKSSVISVKYFIHVTLDIPHAIDLHLNIPIVITTKQALNDN